MCSHLKIHKSRQIRFGIKPEIFNFCKKQKEAKLNYKLYQYKIKKQKNQITSHQNKSKVTARKNNIHIKKI